MDVNNPGQIITLSPNSFSDEIRIKGLDNRKTYGIVLRNNQGQAVNIGQAKKQQVFEIRVAGIAPGVYWLTVYDGKQKTIGSEKVVKLK